VENKLHYTRDVTFLEDQSRIRRNPGVFARIRSFGYNVLRRGTCQ
jgi:predicted transposase YbfD/YdcC